MLHISLVLCFECFVQLVALIDLNDFLQSIPSRRSVVNDLRIVEEVSQFGLSLLKILDTVQETFILLRGPDLYLLFGIGSLTKAV